MDSHLRAVLPVSTSQSVDSMKEAEMNPTACERLRRHGHGWLSTTHQNKSKEHPQAAATPWKQCTPAVQCGKGLWETTTRRGKAQRGLLIRPHVSLRKDPAPYGQTAAEMRVYAKERLGSIPGRYFDGKGKLARFQRSLFRVRSRGLSSCCSLREALKGWPWRECCV
jgi:hypothetical protein